MMTTALRAPQERYQEDGDLEKSEIGEVQDPSLTNLEFYPSTNSQTESRTKQLFGDICQLSGPRKYSLQQYALEPKRWYVEW